MLPRQASNSKAVWWQILTVFFMGLVSLFALFFRDKHADKRAEIVDSAPFSFSHRPKVKLNIHGDRGALQTGGSLVRHTEPCHSLPTFAILQGNRRAK
jgi:hypothetical protein